MQMSRGKYTGSFVGLGRAKVDCVPSPYDNQALPYKVEYSKQFLRSYHFWLQGELCETEWEERHELSKAFLENVMTMNTKIAPRLLL